MQTGVDVPVSESFANLFLKPTVFLMGLFCLVAALSQF